MKTVLKVLLLCQIFLISACEKEHVSHKFCWQLVDDAGLDVNLICDKTESELIECVNNGSCAISGGITTFNNCSYYKAGGEKFCWRINNVLVPNITQEKAQLFARCRYGGTATLSTACDSCQDWFHREQRTFKPTNAVTYSSITVENFCGDTLATLFTGRQIIRKDDVDSLILIQFSENGINW